MVLPALSVIQILALMEESALGPGDLLSVTAHHDLLVLHAKKVSRYKTAFNYPHPQAPQSFQRVFLRVALKNWDGPGVEASI